MWKRMPGRLPPRSLRAARLGAERIGGGESTVDQGPPSAPHMPPCTEVVTRHATLLGSVLLLGGCAGAATTIPKGPAHPSGDYDVVFTVRNRMTVDVELYRSLGMIEQLVARVPAGLTDRIVLSPEVADGCCVLRTQDRVPRVFVSITRTEEPRMPRTD